MVTFQPRLGPARITPEAFANQAFRSTAEALARLPAQWRGAVVFQRVPSVDAAVAKIGNGPCTLEPHDAFLAFSGQDLTA
jgi:hypothetical protein